MIAHDEFGIFGIASIIDFRNSFGGFELSYDAITGGIVRIFVNPIIFVGILLPHIPIGESNGLFII